ncbi:M20/M25/M40 family metallo-hydrolase [Mucilaginibacter segetis]|uniref:M20/M25/M40 family metallo-hydrolase n=1 Tax=Mucilaginibacter segetis TaxID=2793071 RepID=A0A934UN14_9SPHI|nr:M20/M25/M40 family metallo-hydrolase [Mucilaginibacter segetis]MBK0379585.1 M20/M25/M40 family metallo-hydrolase [Mucilaginibacter segetis]
MKQLKLVILLLITAPAFAQTTIRPDAAIKQMTDEVSAKNIKAIVRKLVSFKTRHTLSDTTSKTEGIGAARNWIKAEYEKYAAASGSRMKVEFDVFTQPKGNRIDKDTPMKNVLAILKGTDTADKRIYLVSGHYDSRVSDVMDATSAAPGAVDDASGTALSMELARVMAKHKFPATIIFVAMVGEEQGLYGSTNLAKRAKAEGWDIDAMLNNDIVGNTYGMETGLKDNRSVRVFSEGVPAAETERQAAIRNAVGGENDSPARELARYIKEVGERYVDQLDVKLIYRRDRYLRGGDHTPFSQQGFTAIRVTEMNEDFNRQHQDIRTGNGVNYGDLPDFADYEYTQKVARMNLAVLANLALAPAEPQNVGIVTSGLTNKTQLKWQAPKGNAAAGYYVLMRETSSPVWEKKFYVSGTDATLAYSKDNYLFAVQSVDAQGHESLPVFPKPVR